MSQPPDVPRVNEGFEERWEAWVARGVALDRVMHRNLIVFAIIIVLSALVVIFTGGYRWHAQTDFSSTISSSPELRMVTIF